MALNIMTIVQFGSLVLILFIAISFYFSKLWKVGGLFSSSDILSILIQISLMVWGVLFFFIGLVKLSINSGWSKSTFIVNIGIPLLLVIFFLIKVGRNYLISKNELNQMKDIYKACMKWISIFAFVSEANTELKLNTSKGKPEGKLIVTDVTEQQASKLYSHKNELPEGILLEIYPFKDDDKDLIH